jgi:hypothetical protein
MSSKVKLRIATYINGAPDNVTIVLADIVESDACGVEKLGAAKA